MDRTVDIWGDHEKHPLKQQKIGTFMRNGLVKMTLTLF